MSRKIILIILIILGILVVALGVWVFVESRKSPASNGTASDTSFFASLFPFGSGNGTAPDGTDVVTDPGTGGATEEPALPGSTFKRLSEIANTPTAGFVVVVTPPASPKKPVGATLATAPTSAEPVYPTVRYVESGTGYVFEVGAKGGTPKKISGTVIARTREALFAQNGERIVFRYVKTDNQTIATYVARVVPSADLVTTGTLAGSFLADNISDIVVSPDKNSFLFLLPTATGSAGKTVKADGTGEKQVFTSPFSEWLLDWSALGTVLTTKAAASVPGYAYVMGSGGVMTKVAGGQNGLTLKMSPDGKRALYSVSTAKGLSLHVLNLKDNADVNTGLATLPEKCAWNAAGTAAYCGATESLAEGSYPDSWYQGVTHFNDGLWKVDAATGTTTLITNGEGNYLDITRPAFDGKEAVLVFINKNDGSLWSYDFSPEPPKTAPASPF